MDINQKKKKGVIMNIDKDEVKRIADLAIEMTQPFAFTSKRIIEMCCHSYSNEEFINAVMRILVSKKITIHCWPESGYQSLVDSGKARPLKEAAEMIRGHFIKTGIDYYEKDVPIELPKPESSPNKVAQGLGPDTLRILIELALIQRERGTLKDNKLTQTVWFRLQKKFGSDAPRTTRHVASLMQVLQTKKLIIEDLVYDWQLTDTATRIAYHYIRD